ncbi:MAG: hypothetical protein SVC26_08805 [Pseudomonadota bacterium]|nr:hypothetical protein [Pseudomonadota bacterium]
MHPIDWDSYYHHTCTAHIDIALMPLLDTQLNRARSEAKSFDVLRMKAYGIFSPWSKITKQLPENHYCVVKDHQLESWITALEAAINESQAD